MSVDCIDGADACSDYFEGWEELYESTIWNDREVTVLHQKSKAQGVFDKVINGQEALQTHRLQQ